MSMFAISMKIAQYNIMKAVTDLIREKEESEEHTRLRANNQEQERRVQVGIYEENQKLAQNA